MPVYFLRIVILSLTVLSTLFLYTESYKLFFDGYNQATAINVVFLSCISCLSASMLFPDKQPVNPIAFKEKHIGTIFLVLGLASAVILGIRIIDDFVITPNPTRVNPLNYLFSLMGCLCIKTYFETRKGNTKQ
ncbi:hypothetical protein AOG25_13710 [Vibrio alginolyticus]|nr:hypothetical protein AOG25_13710 [Vibrio alginolyticus]